MRLSDVLVLTMALWRVSSLVTAEHGPAYIFYHLRVLAGVKHDENGYPLDGEDQPKTYLAELMSCIWCFSVNAGVVLATLYKMWPTLTRTVCLPFALSTGTILLDKLINDGTRND